MLIDCETCTAPDIAPHACSDCVVSVLLSRPAEPVTLDEAEQAAIGTLARVGLIPPLRLIADSSASSRDIA
ncbi:MAG: hypothetical protein J0H43_15070 [Actinobacteria bacterium]|nr:hypothetical protein [Actinomycetota bacterium]